MARIHHALHLYRHGLLVVMLIAMVGCASPPPADSSAMPDHLSLQLHMATTDNKYTFFELDHDGELSFGGGRLALMRGAKPVTTISSEQKKAVWDIIAKHRLLAAEGEFIPDFEKVKWELRIRTSTVSLGRTIRTGDDKVPGIRELHDLLFKIQADLRYADPAGLN